MPGPLGPTPPVSPGASIWGPHPKSSNARGSANSRATPQDASASTQNAEDQIARNQQAVQDAQKETDVNLEHIRENYDQASMTETNAQEDALAKQRLKGYEQLRDLRRQQDQEINRSRRDGEKTLKNTQDYYRDTVYSEERKGEQSLQSIKAKQGHEMEYVATTGRTDVDFQKKEQLRKVEELKHAQEQQYGQLSASATTEYERMKTNTALATQQENERFTSEYKNTIDSDQKMIDDLQGRANSQIRQIRQDTAQKLAAYGSRQSDPFYKMVDLNAQLSDEGDHYVLKANIPSHEQDHVSVALKGNALVLSGNRRNEEKLDLGPGKFKGTSSFQSFHESFPLAHPVDRNGLTKEFQGDQVIIRVPKSTQSFYGEGFKAKQQPERIRAERPQFPGNLPDSTVAGSDKKSGRTLT